ncbi:MAG: hypothetical protein ABL962_15870 [Fimbriimonadaceae bacterium]
MDGIEASTKRKRRSLWVFGAAILALGAAWFFLSQANQDNYRFLRGQKPKLEYRTMWGNRLITGRNYNWKQQTIQTERKIDLELKAKGITAKKTRKNFGDIAGSNRSQTVEWQLPGNTFIKLDPAKELSRDSIAEDPDWSQIAIYRNSKASPLDLLVTWLRGH